MSLNLEVHSKELLLEPILQNINEGIIITDTSLNVIFFNKYAEKAFHIDATAILGKHIDSLKPSLNLNSMTFNQQYPVQEKRSIHGDEVMVIKGMLTLAPDNFATYVILRNTCSLEETIPSYQQEQAWEQVQYHHGTAQYYFDSIIGNNQVLVEQKELAAKAARTISTVLITGESGTGKEIFAHAIHNMSPRRQGPFIKVNCAAVPENLLESELFGYTEGAFTGARKEGKPGKFELANHGTIFLDEIGDMSLSMQAKLLRVLQEKEVERVGSIHATKVNLRVIAATNHNLPKLVAENKFREDLFYRLNVIILNLPPLRERIDDILIVSNTLLQRLNRELGTGVSKINSAVIDCFCRYDWPGNIRELENTLERAINFCEGNTINLEHIPEYIRSCAGPLQVAANNRGTLETMVEEHERDVIINTLKKCEGNKTKTAQALNIHRSVLYRKINKYKIRDL